MQILAAGEESHTQQDENYFTPFLTPRHLPATPLHSHLSLLTSQESLEVYHDAYSSLQRPHLDYLGQDQRRQRHASSGTVPTKENGLHLEMKLVEDSAKLNDVLPSGAAAPVGGRTRHASCCTTSPTTYTGYQRYNYSNPYHIGRLSLSTNSLRKKTDRDAPSKRMGSLQKMDRSNGVLNYVPCVEMEKLSEDQPLAEAPDAEEAVPAAVERVAHPEKVGCDSNNAWRRNYVPCVEADRLWGRTDAADCRQEIQLQPGQIEQSNNTVVHMYTFGPVQRRRMGQQRIREEFKVENLRLQHKAPHLFVSSQWQQHNRMSCLYLGYRIFWALYFSMWAVWAWAGSMGYDANISLKGYFMLYMTNWGIWILAVDTTIQAINVILHFKKISEEGEATYPSMTPLMKVSWVLSNITGALHIFITSAYWITVYPMRSDEELNEIGVNTHIMPGLYILLDVAVSATPRRLLHAYQPSLFLTVYTLFNLMYYLCGGLDYMGRPALYPVLDWTRPGSTIGIMMTVLLGLIPLLHAVLCALYTARVKAWRILKISRYVREEDETDQVEEGAQEQKV